MSVGKRHTGFTLVELMLVVAIIGIALSLVGPMTIQQLDNARRNQEREQLTQQLQYWRVYAAQHSRTLYFELNNQRLDIFVEQQSDDLATFVSDTQYQATSRQLGSHAYEHLHFPEQRLMVNANGFWQSASLRWLEDIGGERRENEYQLNNRGVLTDGQ